MYFPGGRGPGRAEAGRRPAVAAPTRWPSMARPDSSGGGGPWTDRWGPKSRPSILRGGAAVSLPASRGLSQSSGESWGPRAAGAPRRASRRPAGLSLSLGPAARGARTAALGRSPPGGRAELRKEARSASGPGKTGRGRGRRGKRGARRVGGEEKKKERERENKFQKVASPLRLGALQSEPVAKIKRGAAAPRPGSVREPPGTWLGRRPRLAAPQARSWGGHSAGRARAARPN